MGQMRELWGAAKGGGGEELDFVGGYKELAWEEGGARDGLKVEVGERGEALFSC
jgi:hypothetical protein